MTQHCGIAAVIGAPNAGKSTLVNALVGEKVAAVSAKAQTTRARLIGIAMADTAQILLVDTPGIFEPGRRLDRAMVAAAWGGSEKADVIALVVDGKTGLGPRVALVLEGLKHRPEPKWLIMNKVDVAAKGKLLVHVEKLHAEIAFTETFFVSAATGDGVTDLKAALGKAMPPADWLFPEDQLSDASQRVTACEVTREQLYRQLHEELPYDSMVETEKYTERSDGSVEIHQQIYVARDSQRAIVLGKRGARIKAIGAAARADLSERMGVAVHLYLHVKVKPDWDEDRSIYRDLGLDWAG